MARSPSLSGTRGLPAARDGRNASPTAPHRAAANVSAAARPKGPAPVRNTRSRPPQRSVPPDRLDRRPRPRPSRSPALLGAGIGVLLAAGAIVGIGQASGCRAEAPPGPSAELGTAPTAAARADQVEASPPAPPGDLDEQLEKQLEQAGVEESATPPSPDDKPYAGPWLGALAERTPIYETARFSSQWMGYIRKGAKVPVIDKPVRTSSCKQGFYPLVDGGYVCGKYATLDMKDARVRLGIKPPNMDAALPYRYAYNSAHGTPLYRAVPSPEQMRQYEPYLDKKKEDKEPKTPKSPASAAPEATASVPANGGGGGSGGSTPPPVASAEPEPTASATDSGDVVSVASASAEPAEEERPWWQRPKGAEVNVTLKELEESDRFLAKRMVKGFFIAIDRTFGLNNRMWYKTTGGLVAPTDRMVIPKTPESHGIALEAGVRQAAFMLSQRGYKYRLDGKKPKRGDRVPRQQAIALTGKTEVHDKIRYRETLDGSWLKDPDITYTDPGPRPSSVGPSEKWIDVNLVRKTLVAFEGDTPVYAALISPGKRSQEKKKDHRTKTGTFRIREKHVTVTMDGDGIAGDLPYSIEDVPYVQYYDGSYALHAAFWHTNFGREQSHGCVNLAPEDAKHVFMWTEPQIPRGWHGVWATTNHPGTTVVIHE